MMRLIIPFASFLKFTFRNKTQIIALAIILSLVSGLGYYFNSMWGEYGNSYFPDFDDVRIAKTDFQSLAVDPALNSTRFLQNDSEGLFTNGETYNYFTLLHPTSYISTQGNNATQSNMLGIHAIDPGAYNSTTFQRNFALLSGQYPQHANEFLVSQSLADLLNLSVFHTYNFSIYISATSGFSYEGSTDTFFHDNIISFPLDNISICGTYLPIKEDITLLSHDYYFTGITLQDYQSNTTTFRRYTNGLYTQIDMPIFTCFTTEENPDLNAIVYEIQTNDTIAKALAKSWFSSGITLEKGIFFSFNQDHLDLLHLDKTIRFLEHCENLLSSSIRTGEYLYFPLLQNMISANQDRASLLLSIQLINLPFLAILAYLGNSIVRKSVNKNHKTFQLLKTRGYTKKRLYSLFISQSLFLSLLSAGIGILFGFGTFYIFKQSLIPIGLGIVNFTGLSFPPIFSADVCILTIVVSLGISACGYAPLFRRINKTSYVNLIQEIGKDPFPVEYNEKTIFKLTEPYRLPETLNQKIHRNISNLTTNDYDSGSFGKKHISHILLLIGVIPLIVYIFIIIKTNSTLTLSEAGKVMEWRVFVAISSIFAIVLIFIGGYRFLFIESDKRLAVIIHRLLSFFHRKFAELNSLLYIRFKRNFKPIFLISIVFSVNIYLNFMLNFAPNASNFVDNLQVGSDLRIRNKLDTNIPISTYDSTTISNAIKNQTELFEAIDWKNQVNIFVQNRVYPQYYSPFRPLEISYIFVNFSAYFKLLADKSEYSYTELSKDEEVFRDFYDNNSDGKIPVIISQELAYIENYVVGVSFDINVDTFQTMSTSSVLYNLKVVNIAEVLPGVHFNGVDELGEYKNAIFIDTSLQLPNLNNILFNEYLVMLNLKDNKGILFNDAVQTDLINEILSNFPESSVSMYNYNWRQPVFIWNYKNQKSEQFFFWVENTVLSLFLAILLGINVSINNPQDDKKLAELFNNKGFPRNELRKIKTNLILFTFFFSVIISVMTAVFPAIVACKDKVIYNQTYYLNTYIPYESKNPLFFNFFDWMLQIFGFLFVAIMVMLIIHYKQNNKFEKRRKIKNYEQNSSIFRIQ